MEPVYCSGEAQSTDTVPQGIYVLTDNNFKPLTKMSLEKGQDGTLDRAQPVSQRSTRQSGCSCETLYLTSIYHEHRHSDQISD